MAAKSDVEMFANELPALGFENISDQLKLLPPDLFAELCQQIVVYLKCQSDGVDPAAVCQRFQAAGVTSTVEDLRKIVHALTSLFSAAAKHKLSCEELLTTVARGNKLPKPILQVIRHVWNEEGKCLSELGGTRDLVPVGQLVDVQWKIGMAVSSDTCRSLNHPYVTLVLKVADYSGYITSKVLEMTIPEFQNFFKQFKEMAAALETV